MDALLPAPASPESAPAYPAALAGIWRTRAGVPLVIRPIRPDDEALVARFHEGLSTDTVYGRYLGHLGLDRRAAHARLERVVNIDYGRVMVLVAEWIDAGTGAHEIVGIGRLMRDPADDAAEFAVVVADAWQRQGIGSELLRRLVEVGRRRGVRRIVGDMLAGNVGMRRACAALGFRLVPDLPGSTVRMALDLA